MVAGVPAAGEPPPPPPVAIGAATVDVAVEVALRAARSAASCAWSAFTCARREDEYGFVRWAGQRIENSACLGADAAQLLDAVRGLEFLDGGGGERAEITRDVAAQVALRFEDLLERGDITTRRTDNERPGEGGGGNEERERKQYE
jgi:hypothetical protein